METLAYRPSGAQEPLQTIVGLFARPKAGAEALSAAEKEWGLICRPPKKSRDAGADEAALLALEEWPGSTVLGPDEVSLENVSMALATGPVAIRATDEQAQRIVERHKRDAFGPE
jgi:hypothetical protein